MMVVTAFQLEAQESKDFHGVVWFAYTLKKQISDKLSWNNDLQFRIRNYKGVYDYTLIRTGLQYELNKTWGIGISGLYGTNNSGAKSLPVWKNEYRLSEDVRLTLGDIARLQLFQQIRIEQRFFEIERIDKSNEELFAIRFRYRDELRRKLNDHWKLLAGNEIMIEEAKGKTAFNQDRVWIGSGYSFNAHNEIQVHLMQIFSKAPDLAVLRLSYFQSFK